MRNDWRNDLVRDVPARVLRLPSASIARLAWTSSDVVSSSIASRSASAPITVAKPMPLDHTMRARLAVATSCTSSALASR